MVGTPINQVRRPINQDLIKDLISPILSVDLWNGERAGRKGGAAGNRIQGLWLSMPVLYCLLPLPVGVVAQWQSTGTESQSPCVWFPAAPPFFPALSPFQRSTDSNGEIRSLIRPWLIDLLTWINWSLDHRTPSCDTAQDPLYINTVKCCILNGLKATIYPDPIL